MSALVLSNVDCLVSIEVGIPIGFIPFGISIENEVSFRGDSVFRERRFTLLPTMLKLHCSGQVDDQHCVDHLECSHRGSDES